MKATLKVYVKPKPPAVSIFVRLIASILLMIKIPLP